MYRYNKTRIIAGLIAVALCFSIIIVCIVPMIYGAASPLQRINDLIDGGNGVLTLLNSTAVAIGHKNGKFDINIDGTPGIFAYDIDVKTGEMEYYWQLNDLNKLKAKYILFRDGISYTFSMDNNGWQFDGKKTESTDINRLLSSIAFILAEQEVNTNDLEQDLNGLVGLDLSHYFVFDVVPTVIRSAIQSFDEESMKSVAGYTFEHENITLHYSFNPANNKVFADRLNALLQPAYTERTQTIISLAGLAGGIADLLGYDLYEILFDTQLSYSVNAISGKLQSLHIVSSEKDIQFTAVQYGNCKLNIDSPSLEALIILNTEN